MTLGVAVLVDNVTVLIDRKANKLFLVTLSDDTNDVARLVLDIAVVVDVETLEAAEWTLRPGDTLVLGKDLTASGNLATVGVDVSILVAASAGKFLDVTFDELTDRDLALVNDETLLVQHLAIQDRVVNLDLLLFCDWLGVTLDSAVLVDNVTVLIDGETDQTLGVALDNLTDNVLVFVGDLAISDDTETLQTGEWSLGSLLALALWNDLALTDNLASVVVDSTLLGDLAAGEFLGAALGETTDWNTIVTDHHTSLVDSLALEDRVVHDLWLGLGLGLWFLPALGVANNRSLLVENVTILVNVTTDKLLGIAFDDNTNLVLVLVLDVAILDDD